MDLYNTALYGDQQNTSAIPASMLSANANGEIDWGAVLANGIRGAAQGAISASVGEKFYDGQLIAQQQAMAQSRSMSNLLLIAVVAYFVLKS